MPWFLKHNTNSNHWDAASLSIRPLHPKLSLQQLYSWRPPPSKHMRYMMHEHGRAFESIHVAHPASNYTKICVPCVLDRGEDNDHWAAKSRANQTPHSKISQRYNICTLGDPHLANKWDMTCMHMMQLWGACTAPPYVKNILRFARNESDIAM